jgi:hypothetical protein
MREASTLRVPWGDSRGTGDVGRLEEVAAGVLYFTVLRYSKRSLTVVTARPCARCLRNPPATFRKAHRVSRRLLHDNRETRERIGKIKHICFSVSRVPSGTGCIAGDEICTSTTAPGCMVASTGRP